MQQLRYFSGAIRTRNWLDRLLVLAVVLLLSIQLLSAGNHKDDHVGQSDDCPACMFAHQLPHGLPVVDVVPAPVVALLHYFLAPVVFLQAPALLNYLIPQGQAPPRG